MNLYFPILAFAILTSAIAYFIYKVVSSESIETEKSLNSFYRNTPEETIEIEADNYIGLYLKNVYYSVIGKFEYDLKLVHKVDNSIFLEFDQNQWISIMYNSVIEVFQITTENPNLLNLDYSLTKMTNHSKWIKFKDQQLKNLDIEFDNYRMYDIPKDLKFNFKDEQMIISFIEGDFQKKDEIIFGLDQLLVQFSKETFQKLRKTNANNR